MLGIDFILNHFPDPDSIFPRTISTYKSRGRQFEVFDKKETVKAFEESGYIDCRINAYPSYTEYKDIQRYPPNFIFADLDVSLFNDKNVLDRALDATLRNVRIKINGSPTVLWTGNGYHIYQPIEALILEQYREFEEFECPSTKFLRFAAPYLTNGKSDRSHNPSFKSCMIRIPGSINSKCANGNNEVKIIRRWDGYRPPINILLGPFHAYMISERKKEIKFQKRVEKAYGIEIKTLTWIEMLLQTPIADYRKNATSLILSPYLVNIKKLSCNDAFMVIKNWLSRCSELRKLDGSFDYIIKYSLNTSIRKRQLPMKFSTLEIKNKELYDLLRERMHQSKELSS